MKKLLLLTLAACLSFSVAFGYDYEIWYGNQDGSPFSVGIDKVIQLPVYMSTMPDSPLTPALIDSIGFMHNPLASNDLIIVTRLGGDFVFPFTWDEWDDLSYLPPDPDPGGYTNQSMIGFADLPGPHVGIPTNTGGAAILMGHYFMRTANDPLLIGTYPCPFQEGNETINGLCYWGNQNGTLQITPIQHYGCLFFSPNQAPAFTAPTGGAVTVPSAGCFTVTAVDGDASGQTVVITGPDGFVVNGAPGADFASGQFCVDILEGEVTVHFVASDGTDTLGYDVVVTVLPMYLDIEGDVIEGEEGACVLGYPGTNVPLHVTLHTGAFYCGGFELLIRWDPTALTYTGTDWLPRINSGSEYHNIIPNAAGPGTARFIWIADVNNGTHTSPATPDADPAFLNSFMALHFNVASGLPFGMTIPVTFEYTGDYTDNTVSDSTGYVFVTPPHSDGCIEIFDFTGLRGDPNMNCHMYEVADAVIVAQRLIQGLTVWTNDDLWVDDGTHGEQACPDWRHTSAFNGAQEAAADLNDNGFADVGDLVWFINILNGIAFPPKLDPVTGTVGVSLNNGVATINSGVEIGAALVRVQGDITPVGNGMDMLVGKANGVTSVLIYSLASARIPAGSNTLFTYSGEGTIVEVSAADSYGRLLDASARPALPTQFAVQQNYPNPFNAKTLISFDLPVNSDVTISIYNIAGQLVKSISGNYEAGHQQVTWDASGVSSGVYFAKVTAGDNSQTLKMTMLK